MALLRNISKFGVTFSNTYNRIGSCNYVNALRKVITQNEMDTTDPDNPVLVPPTVSWVKSRKVEYVVYTYSSESAYNNQEDSIEIKSYGFYVDESVSDVNVLTMAYADLKKQEGYEDATDA